MHGLGFPQPRQRGVGVIQVRLPERIEERHQNSLRGPNSVGLVLKDKRMAPSRSLGAILCLWDGTQPAIEALPAAYNRHHPLKDPRIRIRTETE